MKDMTVAAREPSSPRDDERVKQANRTECGVSIYMNGLMDGWMDGCVRGWMDRWMDG